MLENIKNTKALLLDLDGTVYLDDEVIGDVTDTLCYFREKGIKIVYLTNNSSRTDDEYVAKLKRLGLFDERDVFYSSLDSAVDYLSENHKNQPVYVLATDKVDEYLEKRGIKYSDDADIVLLSFDKELTYQKLVKANALIVKGAKYIATHPDKTCPAKDVFIPDVGSFIGLLKCSSGREPDVIVGKPNRIMAENIVKKLGFRADEITMVGDRLETDIKFGLNCGFNTVLVLSGETDNDKYLKSGLKADLVLPDVNGLKNII